MHHRIARGALAGLLAAALLAGCSKQKEPPVEDEPVANIVEQAPPPEREAEAPPPPKPVEEPANLADALPPEEPVSPDAQMLEDADASGLTARLPPPDVVSDPPADPIGDLVASNGVAGAQ